MTLNLDIGDIQIMYLDDNKVEHNLVIIERKTYDDLSTSIKDGRYREQSYRLTNTPLHNHRIVYLIEGDLSMWSNNRINIKSDTLYVTMFSLLYYQGFSVIRTINIAETAEYILRMVDKMIRNKKGVFYYENENKDYLTCEFQAAEDQNATKDLDQYANALIKKFEKLLLVVDSAEMLRFFDRLYETPTLKEVND